MGAGVSRGAVGPPWARSGTISRGAIWRSASSVGTSSNAVTMNTERAEKK